MRIADRVETHLRKIARRQFDLPSRTRRATFWELFQTFPYHLKSWPQRYAFAFAAVAAATLVRYGLGVAFGVFPPFAVFAATVLIVALLAGFGPGVFATLLSVASVSSFFWAPMNLLGVSRMREIVGLTLFFLIGTGVSALCDSYRRHEGRLQEFQRVVERLEEMIVVVDREYHYLIANRAFLTYRGMKKEQVIGRTIAETLDPEIFESVVKPKVDECFQGKVVQYELRYKFPTLGKRDLSISYFPIEGRGGVDRVVAIVKDITERKRADEALREREEKFHQVADNIQEIFWMVDAITKQAIYVNPAFEQITGRTIAGLLNDPLSYREIIYPDDRAHVLSRLDEAQSTGVFDEEFRIVRPEGTVRWVAAQGFPVRDAQGNIFRLAGVVQDVTDRKRAEEALRESEDRYRDLVEHSEDLLCIHDLQGKLLSANPAPARVLGYTVEELLKIPMRELVAPEFREQFDSYLARIRSKGADEGLLCVVTRNGERRIWDYRNTLRTEGVPSPVVRGMAHDVTDRIRAEQALRRREEDYRMFVAQSSEGIFREDLGDPVPIDLPEDELVHRILHGSYMAECNDAMAKMYGFTSGHELVGKRLTQMLIADDPRNLELTREYIRSGFRVLERTSHEVDVHGNPKVFLNSMIGIVENGKLLRTWGIQRDVTDKVKLEEARKKAVAALRQSEERFRVALQNSPVAVFNQDSDLRYTWIYNSALYQQEGAEILGKTDSEILGAEVAAPLEKIKRRVLETGTSSRIEIPIVRDGKHFYFDITLEPLRDETGKVVGLTGAGMDIARLRELADHLQEQKDKLVQEKLYLESEIQSELGFEEIIGQSPPLKAVLKQARVVAITDATVLLLGETGTGKELIARSIHHLSLRREKNFIKLNCAAVPSGLLESELFGHEKGAFTGAVNQKLGRIELADHGTLFLDEIGELPLELQPKLLRALQDGEFERLGGVGTRHVDARIIAATNRDLQRGVAEKQFRQDLFYRLNVFPIRLPPLRERRSDIPLLVAHFVHKHAARMNRNVESISAETMEALTASEWPGNIRELENIVERMVILAKGPVLFLPAAELETMQAVFATKPLPARERK